MTFGLRMPNVVCSACLRIGEDLVGFRDNVEFIRGSGLLVVRMILLGQKTINFFNCFGICVRADLEILVVVFEKMIAHQTLS